MKTLTLMIATFAIALSIYVAFDAKTYADPPRPATDTTQNVPGPSVSEPDTGKNSVRTGNAAGARTDRVKRPDYGWLGLLGLTGLFGLAGRNRKDT